MIVQHILVGLILIFECYPDVVILSATKFDLVLKVYREGSQ